MDGNMKFFTTTMPETRPADYYLGYFGGSVFIDFDNYSDTQISLKRISFDRYGCCNLGTESIPMSTADSRVFKEIIAAQLSDQLMLTTIIKNVILLNKQFIWEDALTEYGLI